MFNVFLRNVSARPELLILSLMVMIIAMLIIPLPTVLVDFLIGLNIVISLLVFMGSFYIERILSFSTFPALLLLTTLFRLALSISTSRLILSQADAGEIIASFGEFVIGENLVVGFVIFSIVTIVQFIVITKGSERVAEVAARFSLDGMPGKQMSIDGDLKAGAITAEEAKEKRSVLERESQLYGSFDGAMKFIKGDAIAGIIIIFVNFIGGMAIGVGQMGMDLSTALSTYTLLTIGDGLVAQIPALLIAIGAGFIVTRVNGDDANLGRNMLAQMLGHPFVLGVTALLAVGVGLLPGFPLLTFLPIAAALGLLVYFRRRKASRGEGQGDSRSASTQGEALQTGPGLLEDIDNVATETIPLMLLVPTARLDELTRARWAARFRSQFFVDYGLRIPEPQLRGSEALPAHQVAVLINEVRAEQYDIHFDHWRLLDYSPELEPMGFALVHGSDSNRLRGVWVNATDQERVQQLGYHLRPADEECYRCLVTLLARNIQEFFGVQETKQLLDEMETRCPDLLKEVYRHVTVQKIAEVLQRLIGERISVRNMKLILESLAHWASREKDVLVLVEHVRGSLARYISNKFAQGNDLRVLLLSAEFEEVVRRGIRQTSAGSFINLEPAESEELMDRLSVALDSVHIAQKDMVLLCSVDVRRYIKKLIEGRCRELDVMSFGEVSETVSVNVIKTL
ncbi:EscV/YscV/HrcV family type III secretion system export apparatus protein [Pseudomonas umsongensis]|jgi:type III secretion protein V|uniref:EscV/YscV/HrcV family type III secretion system export apparatus protein n=2 Tax=Pseudomonas umsongensis TaxID=198618 RepID=A0AAE6ZY63_9PSED|nr:EscV/YscV/HrcV family type III secretion system export apparatus protein [Pseudomonas umsongensis]KEX90185.1 type III secretion system protein InvA [Pseudomonas putida]OXR29713.1 EscV/YscV/HrcV family type III secretion system export apparatus protein [Pseudomonas umsongensis]QFG31653.1 EscV/YscV/HrcV family type III secretion system export apparatus protein [Pseudomonas umsongensis]QJC80995.1 EscV/YscV/HrcV family type III secretion system export apparatus protein [Pseudomonas umsongensis]